MYSFLTYYPGLPTSLPFITSNYGQATINSSSYSRE